MKRRMAALVAALLATCLVGASAKEPPKPVPAASAPASQVAIPADRLVEQGSYVNSDGNRIHAPAHTAGGAAPAGARAHCRDGSFSFSAHARGTCSHHGGVAQWL
jgi:hypothetical protein